MVRCLVMCDISKTVCAFWEEGGERTKNRYFAHNYPEESDNTTQTLYCGTQKVLLSSWHCVQDIPHRIFAQRGGPTM